MNREICPRSCEGIKIKEDLSEFSQRLTKVVIETALNAELDDHLGYDRRDQPQSDNRRNGYSNKILRTEDGEFELNIPRDRQGDFKLRLIKKRQTRFTSLDGKIQSLYTKGMTTRDIVSAFKEMYGVEVSAPLISRVMMQSLSRWNSQKHEF